MHWRLICTIGIAIIVAGAGHFAGVTGALAALPACILVSMATERILARSRSSDTIGTLRRKR